MSKRKTHIYLNFRVYLWHIYHKYRKNCKTLINYRKKLVLYYKNFHLIARSVSFPLVP